MRCCWCEKDGVAVGTPVCPFCRKSIAQILPPGTVLRQGRYRIERAIGKGGFGITYRVTDTMFDRRIALKEFFPSSHAHRDPRSGSISVGTDESRPVKAAMEGFIREGKHLASVSHRSIPAVFDRFEENGTAYLAMEFIEGQSVKSLLQSRNGGPLPENDATYIVGELVEAISAIHAAGICHLDIKPDNVLIDRTGRITLVDFGAARQGSHFDTTSLAALTPGYAPPELMRRDQYGPETDLFELGVMFYQLLSGQMPPAADARLYVAKDWQPDSRVVRDPWRRMILQAIVLDRTQRPNSVRAWWQARGGPVPRTAPVAPAAPGGFVPSEPTPTQFALDSSRMAPEPSKRPTAFSGAALVVGGGLTAAGIAALVVASLAKPAPPTDTPIPPEPASSPIVQATVAPTRNAAATQRLKDALNQVLDADKDELAGIASEAEKAMQEGADPDTRNRKGLTVLHLAAALGQPELARAAIAVGASPNLKEGNGYTALHLAAMGDAAEVIHILLQAGADKTVTDDEGMTPLERARKNKKTNAEQALQ